MIDSVARYHLFDSRVIVGSQRLLSNSISRSLPLRFPNSQGSIKTQPNRLHVWSTRRMRILLQFLQQKPSTLRRIRIFTCKTAAQFPQRKGLKSLTSGSSLATGIRNNRLLVVRRVHRHLTDLTPHFINIRQPVVENEAGAGIEAAEDEEETVEDQPRPAVTIRTVPRCNSARHPAYLHKNPLGNYVLGNGEYRIRSHSITQISDTQCILASSSC